jgi:polysaccharide pyruvyl transferase WcaK-like protein
VLPALKQFYLENPGQYEIIVASDQHYPNDGETFEEVRKFAGEDAYYYQYGENPLELCSVIKSCDCVITYKLHVGIVAAAYSKSVIPVPQHHKKVQKYYNQIGQGERVLPLKDATIEKVFQRISRYIHEPIVLPEQIFEKARENNLYLEAFISKLQGGAADEK